MAIGRREWIGLAGGAAVGTALSPVPWKLLDDSAIWTQNWSWTPLPIRGPTSEKYGLCTLCGSGCGLKARCGAAGVYGLAPVAAHPGGGGALCPVVYGAHQLPYHPRRLTSGIVNGRDVDSKQALTEAMQRIQAVHERKARFVILDERPGRILSELYAQVARQAGGTAVTLSQVEDRTLRAMEELARVEPGSLCYDFERAGIILSIGAPLLDMWGSASRMGRLWSGRSDAAAPMFVHAGSRWSRTAQLADRTMLLRPGSEGAFVAALAGRLPLEEAARMTGLTASSISELSALLRERGPAIVVGGGEAASSGLPEATERMIAALNASLGSLGREGGVVLRRRVTTAPALPGLLNHVEDYSIALLIHDASSAGVVAPEALIRRKLARDGTLVRLIAYRPENVAANDIVIPATAFLEGADDACGPRDACLESWSYSEGLKTPPDGVVAPQAFVAAFGEAMGLKLDTYESLRDAKAQAIVAGRRGKLYRFADGEETPLSDLDSFRTAMVNGAVWVDDPAKAKALHVDLGAVDWTVREPSGSELVAVAVGMRGSMSALPAIPLASKVERETRLQAVPDEVRMNPRTAQALNLKPGDTVSVETEYGETGGKVRCDAATVPGQLELAACGLGRQAVLEAIGAGDPEKGPAPAARIRRS